MVDFPNVENSNGRKLFVLLTQLYAQSATFGYQSYFLQFYPTEKILRSNMFNKETMIQIFIDT